MTAREINLISTQKIETSQERKLKKFAYYWSPLILGIYCLLLVATLGVSFYFTSRVTAAEKGIAIEQKAIAAKEQDEGLYLLLKQKMNALSQILVNRSEYTQLFDFFYSFQTDKARIIGLTINENSTIALRLSVVDSTSLDTFVQSLLDVGGKKFSSIELESLSYDIEVNAYSLVFSFVGINPSAL